MTPRLVLLHGTRMTRRQWEPYRAMLPDVELVAVDLPGHGERAGEEFTRDAVMRTVDEAVGGPGEERATVLAGHSLGGYLATMWAAEHPGSLGALVIIGATADPSGSLTGLYRGFAKAVPHLNMERTASGMNALFKVLGARGEHAAALPDGSGYAALPAAWQLVIDEARPGLLASVDCPVWMVNGQLDQMRLHVDRFAAAAREPHVVTVSRATHLMPSTHPEQVAAVLREAVDSVR